MSTVHYKDQNFRILNRFLRAREVKFVDPEFPGAADDWKRPTELVQRPRLITDGISGPDATPGDRGSTWFATACSVLTARPDIIGLTVPGYMRQDYGGNFHPGIFRFAFARHGRIFEVVVDDRLPARGQRPLRCRSSDGKEFWCALLEKAYAKLHGGYDCLHNGRIADAIASFARGIPDHWDLRLLRAQVDLESEAAKERIGRLFQFHLQWDSLLLFSLRPESKSQPFGSITPDRLVCGRGYLLVDVQVVRSQDGNPVWLLRLQTARYEDGNEWRGPWKEGGAEWSQLDTQSAGRAAAWFKTECTFWMSLPDALTRFTDLDMCLARSCGPSSAPHLPSVTLQGAWGPGGSPDGQPQFLLRVLGDDRQTVTLCLEQGEGPEAACRPDLQVELGLELLRVEENRRCRLPPHEVAGGSAAPAGRHVLVASAAPMRRPSVTLGASFAPGSYVVLPRRVAGSGPDTATFTLRAFSRLGFALTPITEAAPSSSRSCTRGGHKSVSRLVVESVSGLDLWLAGRGDWRGGVKLKLQVTCAHSDVASWQSRYYCADPALESIPLDLRLLIHRYQLGHVVKVEVFHSCVGASTKTPVGWANLAESSTPSGQDVALASEDGQPISVRLCCSLSTLDEFDGF